MKALKRTLMMIGMMMRSAVLFLIILNMLNLLSVVDAMKVGSL